VRYLCLPHLKPSNGEHSVRTARCQVSPREILAISGYSCFTEWGCAPLGEVLLPAVTHVHRVYLPPPSVKYLLLPAVAHVTMKMYVFLVGFLLVKSNKCYHFLTQRIILHVHRCIFHFLGRNFFFPKNPIDLTGFFYLFS
jgi:hypothetical protein